MMIIFAQTTTTVAPSSGTTGSPWISMLLWAAMLGAIFYFLMIRPQRKRLTAQQQLLAGLAANDEVVTIGGIFGQIDFIGDDYVILRVEAGGRLRVARQAIARKVGS